MSPLRHLIGVRRFMEATLVIFIIVAYLLVVTRGQIVTTLVGNPAGNPTPYMPAPTVTHPLNSAGETVP